MVRPSRIPLRYRAPNGPPLFLGRDEELAWIERALTRAPIAILRGPSGIGKTSLALRAVAGSSRAVLLGIERDQPADQVRLNLAHLLANAVGEPASEIASVQGDPEELVAIAIDLAERERLTVVLDDLQNSDPSEIQELVYQIAAHARESRWIATTHSSRSLIELEAQVLQLASLPEHHLVELATLMGQSPDRAASAAVAAGGSPWLLKQYVQAGERGLALTREGILASIPSPAFLRTLAALRLPLDMERLASIGHVPAPAERDALIRQGLILQDNKGWMAHDLVRDFLFPVEEQNAADTRALAEALRDLDHPNGALEALRLFLNLGLVDEAGRVLTIHGHELFACGQASAVWGLLGQNPAAALDLWRLQAAVELGNSTVLSALQQPNLKEPRARFAWATTQYLMGQPSDALHTLASLSGTEEGDVLAARCSMQLGDLEGAHARLKNAKGRAARALRLVLDAYGEGDSARQPTLAFAAELQDDEALVVLLDVATALYRLADRSRADALLKRVLMTPRGRQASVLTGRRALLLRARIAIDEGRLRDASAVLETVRPYARGMSILRPELIELDGRIRMLTGEFEGTRRLLEHGLELAQDVDVRMSALLQDALSALSGEHARELPWAEPIDVVRIRAQGASLRTALPAAENTGDAIEALGSLVQSCKRRGLITLAAEYALLLGDALLIAQRPEEAKACGARLEAYAESLPSPRFRLRARFLAEVGEVATLELLAASKGAPVAARRARAILQGERNVDALDEAVLARLPHWPDRHVQTPIAGGAPCWGLNEIERSVWCADRTVHLAKTPLLWRVLCTLMDGGGAATKEALIEHAWKEPAYHPLRHDAKIHVAIRKLRNLLGEDATRRFIVTVEDGYKLGGTVRRVRHVGDART